MRMVFSAPYLFSMACWSALEAGLTVRDLVWRRARFGSDRGTRAIVALSLGASIALSGALRRWVPALNTPTAGVFAGAGLVAIWAGLALRVWAVITLGRSFSTYLRVDAGQAVVTRGPYRRVRHPSYAGLRLPKDHLAPRAGAVVSGRR